jgi:hypothetical protein
MGDRSEYTVHGSDGITGQCAVARPDAEECHTKPSVMTRFVVATVLLAATAPVQAQGLSVARGACSRMAIHRPLARATWMETRT